MNSSASALKAPRRSAKEIQAHRDSVRLSPAQMVERLQPMLGGRLLAYLGGVKETRAVAQWAAGDRDPSPSAIDRFRIAYQAAEILLERESAGTVQAWFQGMNPDLGDEAPAWVLRRYDLEEAGPAVVAAARRFAAAN